MLHMMTVYETLTITLIFASVIISIIRLSYTFSQKK
ncbi:putative holin-like toxin [Metasolibacillus fluoroglycofenilyticus]